MAPLRVAILGTGLSLQAFHYPLISALPDQFVLHCVMERSGRGKAQEVCGKDTKVVKTIEEVVNDPEVDVVVVSTPNNTHYPFTMAALEHGKHVMLEKPATPTVSEAEKLASFAKEKGLILCVYQNRRWDADFLTLKKLLDNNTLGPIHEITTRFDRFRPLPADHKPSGWKETPGEHNEAIYNLGSHVIDQIVSLYGMPDKVSCRNFDQRGIGLDEAFDMTLIYPPQPGCKTPLTVHLGASILSASPKQLRYYVQGAKGGFVKYHLDPQEPFLRAGKKVKDEGYGIEDAEAYGTLNLFENGEWKSEPVKSEKGWYPAIYENFADAINSKDATRLAVQPEQVINVMKLIELANQSSTEGKVIDVK